MPIAEAGSLPLRKCGLKFSFYLHVSVQFFVTSLAEVWIEITVTALAAPPAAVTSLAEVWIEIPLPVTIR